jgi:hypothetical protein
MSTERSYAQAEDESQSPKDDSVIEVLIQAFTPSDEIIDFFAPWLPLANALFFSVWTMSRLQKPTWEISFWGLFWIPYHEDMPFEFALCIFLTSLVSAIFSILYPRFPRALRAYSKGAGRTKLPLKAHKLQPKRIRSSWGLVSAAIFVGIVLNRLMSSGALRPIIGLIFYTLVGAVLLYIVLHALCVLWLAIRYYPERPPLGLVPGLLWPPAHPLQRFFRRAFNRTMSFVRG